MRVRLKFSKTDAMKFIGHLDIMRTFQKIFRQGDVPIAYSGGYSPHQVFSIAAPLPVGVTSEGEYIDLELDRSMELTQLIDQINACCPNGLKILYAVIIDSTEPAAMASVSAATYCVYQKEVLMTTDQINAFAMQETMIISKKNKKGNRVELDIKPGIFNITVDDNKVLMTLATGSVFNIKPDAIFQAYSDFIGVIYDPFNYKLHRKELYHGEKELISLSVPIMPVF